MFLARLMRKNRGGSMIKLEPVPRLLRWFYLEVLTFISICSNITYYYLLFQKRLHTMSVNSDVSQGGLGGGLVLGASTSVTAGIVLPQTGLLPQTGASGVSLIVIIAVLTFAIMIVSRLVSKAARLYLSRQT